MLVVVALSIVGAGVALGEGSSGGHDVASGWPAQSLQGESRPDAVQNNVVAGALESRDRAAANWRTVQARYRAAQRRARGAKGRNRLRLTRRASRLAPDPTAKPEYVVVFSGNSNASDENTQSAQGDAGQVLSDPLRTGSHGQDRFVPGLDGFVVLDARKHNTDGSKNPSYGKVANFVQLPPPWGVEAEPHHMQYQWEDGQPILAGGLFNDTTFVLDAGEIPKLTLKNTIAPQDTPFGSVPDAYDAAGDGRLIGTYMGGPDHNYAGSPGEVVVFKPDPEKGVVVASETAAGAPNARDVGNPGGLREPCGEDEAAPLNSCANPHGIQVRPDLQRMVTSDYAEPKMVVLDPAKPDSGRFFRPTVRIWNTSKIDAPKLVSVAHMVRGWRAPAKNAMHNNRGVMENAKTWPRTAKYPRTLKSNGFFAGAMCGGGVFFTPDVKRLAPDSSRQWKQVFDDGIALVAARHGSVDRWLEDEGPCQGGGWMQVSRDNKRLFRAVMGQAPNVENLTTRGQQTKVVYDVDVRPLIKSARDGSIACDFARGVDTDGDGLIDLEPEKVARRVALGKQVADCPRLISTVTVDDPTSGGPHWGALDNHSLTASGAPTRLVFSDYFVARSGVDGDHRLFMVNVNPATGKLSYDRTWRDEVTGKLGTDFNRTDWPGNPGAGFYKPHSMVWVCPPGVCPSETASNPAGK